VKIPLDFLSPVALISGCGPQREFALKQSGIYTIGDLLYYLPRSYVDRSHITPVQQLLTEREQTSRFIVLRAKVQQSRIERGKKSKLRVRVADSTGSVTILFFHGIPWLQKLFRAQKEFLFWSTTNVPTDTLVHPGYEPIGKANTAAILPVYSIAKTMSDASIGQSFLRKCIRWCLENVDHFPRRLPPAIEENLAEPDLKTVLQHLHFPQQLPGSKPPSTKRLIWEELYELAVTTTLFQKKFIAPKKRKSFSTSIDEFCSLLNFKLSSGQIKAIETIISYLLQPRRFAGLINGDVGSGKTVVAFAVAQIILRNQKSVVWLSPSQILAQQSFSLLKAWSQRLFPELSVELLTGQTPEDQRRRIISTCSQNKQILLVGTHALLNDTIANSSFDLFIIDEQHKFGVQQRRALQNKQKNADVLVLSATPIPRSLTATLYGDLTCIEMPIAASRRPQRKSHIVKRRRFEDLIGFLRKALQDGAKMFWIVPRIESQDPAIADIQSRIVLLKKMYFPDTGLFVLHGQCPAELQSKTMLEFKQSPGNAILLATSIVEVGIDVAGANIMVIENADFFGLASLHQLRGRIGRDANQSHLFLPVDRELSPQSATRLKTFINTENGFELARHDLYLRGPGTIDGTRQSGWGDLRFANIIEHHPIFTEMKQFAEKSLLGC